jgi:hypothetical protein
MNLQQIIESAQLDALGLLEGDDLEKFEVAFAALPAAHKAMIRAEQERVIRFGWGEGVIEGVAADASFAPPAELKDRILTACHGIGRKAHAPAATTPSVRRAISGRRVTHWWRASALGMAAACVVLGVAFVQLLTSYDRISDQNRSNAMQQAMSSEMGGYASDMVFDAKTQRVTFASRSGFAGKATVFTSPEWKKAQLHCLSLPTSDGQTYKLVVTDSSGAVERLVARFQSNGGMMSLEVNVSAAEAGRLAVVMVDKAGRETIVLTTFG